MMSLVVAGLLFAGTAAALTPEQGKKITEAARKKIGTPYKLPPDGFPKNTDCSLLTQWAYAQAGITIPRTAAAQFKAMRPGTAVGGLLFFDTRNRKPAEVTHVGIDLGGGMMLHASSSKGVVIVKWDTPYWKFKLMGRRVP
jgi:cell wall-associated NlpC family hydrolase